MGIEIPDELAINCTNLGNTSKPEEGKQQIVTAPATSEQVFQQGISTKDRMMMLIMDEMDYLITRDRAVLHDLFMLATFPFSRCILIGIANAIDLADRFLPKLESLNCKPLVVTFHAYSKDQISDIIKHRLKIKKDRIMKLVVLPLYPQYSISTSGSSIRVLQGIVKEDSYFSCLPISIIESWYQRDGYVKSMADLIEIELSIFSNPEEVMIFFSAHGAPLTYVEDAGDPYRDQMEECIALIMGELRSRGILNSHTLACQSRGWASLMVEAIY